MLIFREYFKTQSHQNIHENAPNFSDELSYAPEPPEHMRATIISLFHMKIATDKCCLYST